MLREDYKFYPRRWNAISAEGSSLRFPKPMLIAKIFIAALLRGDPAQRLTAEEALKHPWFYGHNTSDLDLFDRLCEGFNARATYRRAFEKIRVVNKIMLLGKPTKPLTHKIFPGSSSSLEKAGFEIGSEAPPFSHAKPTLDASQ